ncbi:MAG: enoyl-[acyl-carrier-protein] reductase FabK [Candidatus Ozemobacteraceae bacterium]
MIETRITKLLGIRYPILQGGMAWVSSAPLVAAVSNAGGLGILGSGPMDPETFLNELRAIKSMTDKPFGVNIMLMMPSAPELIKLCISERVPVVTTGAGNPAPFIKAFKEVGTKVIPVVAAASLAKRLERSGADAIIAEGNESGGHIGEITTMVLVPQVVDAVQIPVIAAGGIGDGRGVLAALSLGAEGVQMGTRFIMATECHVHENYKKAIATAKDRDSIVTGQSTGHPVRVLKNKLAKYFLEREAAGATPEELDAIGKGSLRKSVVDGDVDGGSVMAGQICGMLNTVESTARIFQRLEEEFFRAQARVADFIRTDSSHTETSR